MAKPMISRRRFLRTSGSAVTLALLSACGAPAPTEPTGTDGSATSAPGAVTGKPFAGKTVSVATLESELAPGVEVQMDAFKEATGATINLSKLPGAGAEFHTKIQADLSSGTGIFDVVIEPFLFLHSYAAAGLILPLDPFVAKDPSIAIDDFIPLLLDRMGRFKGALYALPYKADAYIFFYRKDFFEDAALQQVFKAKTGADLKVPDTAEQAVAIARFFTKKFNPDSPTEFGWNHMASRGGSAVWIWASRLAAYGGNYLDASFKPAFNNDAGRKAIEHAVALNECCPPDVGNYGWDEANAAFVNGKVAMMEQWPGLYMISNTTDGSAVAGKVGAAVLPGVSVDGKVTKSSILGGWACAISKYAKDPDLAYTTIAFLTSKEGEIRKAAVGNDPCRTSSYANEQLRAQKPLYPVLLDSLSQGRITADIDAPPVSDKLQDIMGTAMHRVWIGELSPEDALNQTEQEWIKLLKDAKLLAA